MPVDKCKVVISIACQCNIWAKISAVIASFIFKKYNKKQFNDRIDLVLMMNHSLGHLITEEIQVIHRMDQDRLWEVNHLSKIELCMNKGNHQLLNKS